MSTRDPSDRRGAMVFLALIVLAALVVAGLLLWGAAIELPKLQAFVSDAFSPGLGLRGAAIIAAVVSFLALIALTLAAGDGILGEIHFVLPGFFVFFLFFWLMAAWVF